MVNIRPVPLLSMHIVAHTVNQLNHHPRPTPSLPIHIQPHPFNPPPTSITHRVVAVAVSVNIPVVLLRLHYIPSSQQISPHPPHHFNRRRWMRHLPTHPMGGHHRMRMMPVFRQPHQQQAHHLQATSVRVMTPHRSLVQIVSVGSS